MFTASYPANFLPEANGKGFHVRFRDLPEALTGGDDLEDTLAQAADCLAEAIAGRSRPRRDHSLTVQSQAGPAPHQCAALILRRSWHYTWQCVNAAYQTLNWPSAWA